MNRHALAAILALCAMAFIASALWLIPSSSAAKPVEGLNLIGVFAVGSDRGDARNDAADLAGIARANARWLERDGLRPEPQRLIRTWANMAEYRDGVKAEMLEKGFRGKYPQLGPTVGEYLTTKAGNRGNTLSDEHRKAWVQAFDNVADAAIHAEAGL